MTHLRRLGLADTLRTAAPLPVSYAQDVVFCTALTRSAAESCTGSATFQLVPGRYDPTARSGQQIPQPDEGNVLRAVAAAADHPADGLGVGDVSYSHRGSSQDSHRTAREPGCTSPIPPDAPAESATTSRGDSAPPQPGAAWAPRG